MTNSADTTAAVATGARAINGARRGRPVTHDVSVRLSPALVAFIRDIVADSAPAMPEMPDAPVIKDDMTAAAIRKAVAAYGKAVADHPANVARWARENELQVAALAALENAKAISRKANA